MRIDRNVADRGRAARITQGADRPAGNHRGKQTLEGLRAGDRRGAGKGHRCRRLDHAGRVPTGHLHLVAVSEAELETTSTVPAGVMS